MPLMIRWADGRGRTRLRRLAGRTTVGSGNEVDLRLDHPTVAARHAALDTPDGATLTVVPLDPAAAIFRNGMLCRDGETVSLAPGDRVGFGAVTGSICTERPVEPSTGTVPVLTTVARAARPAPAPVPPPVPAIPTGPATESETIGERLRSAVASVSPMGWVAGAMAGMVLLAVMPVFLALRHVAERQKAKASATPPPASATPVPEGVTRARSSLVEISVQAWSSDRSHDGWNHRAIGFTVSERGYVIANAAGLDGASRVSVTFQNGARTVSDTIVFCSFADLALVKISGAGALLPPTLAATSGAVPGEAYLFLEPGKDGRPGALRRGEFGQRREVDGRWLLEVEAPGGFVPGGPVLDEKGSVVGVGVGRIAGAPGLGYAVPVEELHGFLQIVGLE